MKAVWYERTGPAREVLRVGDLPTPEPGPGEVRVRVRAAGVNPADWKRRAGWNGITMEFPKQIPGDDGAGEIDAVGPGVPAGRVGERVWLWLARNDGPFGTAAESVVVPADHAVPLPEGTGFAEGACLGVPALTAHRCVFGGGPVAGKAVLVQGGAGAVGYYAVQLAKWGGATVLATAGRAEQAAEVRAVGADQVVIRGREDVAARVRELTGGAGVDRVVEVTLDANAEADVAMLKTGGDIWAYSCRDDQRPPVPFLAMQMKNLALHAMILYTMPAEAKRRAVADVSALLAAGTLKHRVARRFPLRETAVAHEAVEAGGVNGKVIVDVA